MKETPLSTQNLKLRSRTWYARLSVPLPLQPVIGRTELVRSLKTRDLREANRLKYRALDIMQTEMSRAVTIALPTHAGGDVLAVAEELSAAVAKGAATQEAAEVAF